MNPVSRHILPLSNLQPDESYIEATVQEHHDMTYTLQTTNAWMFTFASEFIIDLQDTTRLGTILHLLRTHEPSIRSKEFSAITMPSSQEQLFVHHTKEQPTIHKIVNILARGSFATIYEAGSWAIRFTSNLKTKDERIHAEDKCRRAKTYLTKIHHQGEILGIESIPKDVSLIDTHTFDQTVVTVSIKAFGNATRRIPVSNRHLVAHHITQGLLACITAEICHLDIKQENILLYGTKDHRGNMNITKACLCDFEDAMSLESFSSYMEHCTRTHTPSCVLQQDIKKLSRLQGSSEHFSTFRELAYQISIFEMGIVLYELYTQSEIPVDDDPDTRCIISIDSDAIKTNLMRTKPSLSPSQQEVICKMLDIDAMKRPSASQIAQAFIRDAV